MTNGCDEEGTMDDKNNATSAYDCSSNTRQMTALRAAQALFASGPPPQPPANTGSYSGVLLRLFSDRLEY